MWCVVFFYPVSFVGGCLLLPRLQPPLLTLSQSSLRALRSIAGCGKSGAVPGTGRHVPAVLRSVPCLLPTVFDPRAGEPESAWQQRRAEAFVSSLLLTSAGGESSTAAPWQRRAAMWGLPCPEPREGLTELPGAAAPASLAVLRDRAVPAPALAPAHASELVSTSSAGVFHGRHFRAAVPVPPLRGTLLSPGAGWCQFKPFAALSARVPVVQGDSRGSAPPARGLWKDGGPCLPARPRSCSSGKAPGELW